MYSSSSFRVAAGALLRNRARKSKTGVDDISETVGRADAGVSIDCDGLADTRLA